MRGKVLIGCKGVIATKVQKEFWSLLKHNEKKSGKDKSYLGPAENGINACGSWSLMLSKANLSGLYSCIDQ